MEPLNVKENQFVHNVIKEEPAEFVLILPPVEEATKLQNDRKLIKAEKGSFEMENQSTSIDVPRVQCIICKKFFKNKMSLGPYKLMEHNVHKFWYCDLCEYKTPVKQNISLHMIRHKNDFSFKCPDCFKFYKYLRYVKQHQKLVQ